MATVPPVKKKRGRPPGSKNKKKSDTSRPSRPGRGRGCGRGRGRGAGTSNFMDISVEDTVYHEMNEVNVELDEVVERLQRERMNLENILQEGSEDLSLKTVEVTASIPVVPQPTGVRPNMYPSYTPLSISPPHQVPVVPQPTGVLPAIYPSQDEARQGDY